MENKKAPVPLITSTVSDQTALNQDTSQSTFDADFNLSSLELPSSSSQYQKTVLAMQSRLGNAYAQRTLSARTSPMASKTERVAIQRQAVPEDLANDTTTAAPDTATTDPVATDETPTPEQWDAQASERIQAFLQAFQNIPVTVRWQEEGAEQTEVVTVQPPYFINAGRTTNGQQRLDNAHRHRSAARGAEGQIVRGANARLNVGKATPEDIAGILQQAVDQNVIRAGAGRTHPNSEDLRAWLQRYGFGIDCSGFVAQALNQVVDGAMGDDAVATDDVSITGTNSAALQGQAGANQRFARIDNPHDAGTLRPGDTMHIPGHIRIVSQVGTDTDGNVKFMTAESRSSNPADIGPATAVWRFYGPDHTLQRKESITWADDAADVWRNGGGGVTYGRFRTLDQLRTAQTQPPVPGATTGTEDEP